MARIHRDDLISADIVLPELMILQRSIFGDTWTREVGPKDFVSPMEAGVALRVHRVTVYDWISKGLLKVHETEYGSRLRWGDVYKFAAKRGLLD